MNIAELIDRKIEEYELRKLRCDVYTSDIDSVIWALKELKGEVKAKGL